MLDCYKAQERVNGPKEQEDKTLRIKDTSGLHLYRVRPSHSFTPPPPGQQTKMSGTISPRDRLQLWVNTFLLKQKENSGSVTATFRDL